MIPWGSTHDGGSYLWVTDRADPDEWTVWVEWDLYGAQYAQGMADLLVWGLTGGRDGLGFSEGFPSSRPASVDPIVPLVRARVTFAPAVQWTAAEVATLRRVFAIAQDCDEVNGVVVRPQRWTLVWHPGALQLDVLSADVDLPKATVAALAKALGVRITSASPDSWADLVSRP